MAGIVLSSAIQNITNNSSLAGQIASASARTAKQGAQATMSSSEDYHYAKKAVTPVVTTAAVSYYAVNQVKNITDFSTTSFAYTPNTGETITQSGYLKNAYTSLGGVNPGTNTVSSLDYLKTIGMDANKIQNCSTVGRAAELTQEYHQRVIEHANQTFSGSSLSKTTFNMDTLSSKSDTISAINYAKHSLSAELTAAKGQIGQEITQNGVKTVFTQDAYNKLASEIASKQQVLTNARDAMNTNIVTVGRGAAAFRFSDYFNNVGRMGVNSVAAKIISGGDQSTESVIRTTTNSYQTLKMSADQMVRIGTKFATKSIDTQVAALKQQILANPAMRSELQQQINTLLTQKAKMSNFSQNFHEIITGKKFRIKADKTVFGKGEIFEKGKALSGAEKAKAKADIVRQAKKSKTGLQLNKRSRIGKKLDAKRAKMLAKKTGSRVVKQSGKHAARQATNRVVNEVAKDVAKKNWWKRILEAFWKKAAASAKATATAAGTTAAAAGTTAAAGATGSSIGGAVAGGSAAAVESTPVGWIITIIICVIMMLVVLCIAIIPGVGYIAVHFLTMDVSTDLQGHLDNLNYGQVIANLATYDLAAELELICEDNAYEESLNRMYVAKYGIPAMPDPNYMKQSGNVYVWEEVDDETIWEENGKKIYADYNIAKEADRNKVTVYDNIVPIMNMMHMKMQDEIGYEHWHEALAYVYYMYAMSHNVNIFDAGEHSDKYIYLYDTENKNKDGTAKYTGFRLEKNNATGGAVFYCHGDGILEHDENVGNYDINSAFDYRESMDAAGNQRPFVKEENGSYVCHNFKRNTTGCKNAFYHDDLTSDEDTDVDYNNHIVRDIDGGAYSAANVANLYHFKRLYGASVSGRTNEQIITMYNHFINAFDEKTLKDMGFCADANVPSTATKEEKYAIVSATGGTESYNIGIRMVHNPDEKLITGMKVDDMLKQYRAGRGSHLSSFDSEEQNRYQESEWKECNNYTYLYAYDEREADAGGDPVSWPYWSKRHDLDDNFMPEWFSAKYDDNTPMLKKDDSYKCGHWEENGQEGWYTGFGSNADSSGQRTGYNYRMAKPFIVCCGHCGGHIRPSTDMIQMMTYEGLAQLDGFKTIHWESYQTIISPAVYSLILSEALRQQYPTDDKLYKAAVDNYNNIQKDVKSGWFLGYEEAFEIEMAAISELKEPVINSSNKKKYLKARYESLFAQGNNNDYTYDQTVTFLEWRAYWNDQSVQWFAVFPSSPKGLVQSIARTTLYKAAGIVDKVTGWVNGLLKKVKQNLGLAVEETTKEEDLEHVIDEKEQYEDIYQFTGWFTEDKKDYDESAMAELKDLYGSYYTDAFESGIELWQDFGVTFDDKYIKLDKDKVNVPPNFTY